MKGLEISINVFLLSDCRQFQVLSKVLKVELRNNANTVAETAQEDQIFSLSLIILWKEYFNFNPCKDCVFCGNSF